MTFAAMQWHESVTLQYSHDDYRRSSLVELGRRLATGQRVLDMRCLTGHLSVALAAEGRDVVGLDAYEDAVKMTNVLAQERGLTAPLARWWDLTGLAQRVDGQQFDCVICFDVLNHVADDEQTAADIAQVLVPGGRLVVTAPAFPWLLGPRDRSLGHLRRYTRAGLHGLLERHGFVVERMRYWNFAALPAYVLVEKLARRRLSDPARYARQPVLGATPNRILRWWYTAVENRLVMPIGLTHVVVASRRGSP